ncbi:hypothetical protein [Nocardioides sp. WS12]|uniref:hypothetical protein n=1 Tax=Nocardioides sp. WS12 TaxID=2486272 RepID=UPI00191F437A|nr:hypothetical protein [Nocardioides sp. WS12]
MIIAALVPVALLYLLPRITGLVATPYRLDQAVVHADAYNPGLHQVVEHEKVTLAAFDALDQVKTALANVRETDAQVARELERLIGQITANLQGTLNTAHGNVGGMLTSLNQLTAHLNALHGPVNGASAAVKADRDSLARILAEARATAAEVKRARISAETSASNVSGE